MADKLKSAGGSFCRPKDDSDSVDGSEFDSDSLHRQAPPPYTTLELNPLIPEGNPVESAEPVQPTTEPSTDPATPNPTNPASSGSSSAPVSADNSNDPGYIALGLQYPGGDDSGLPTRRTANAFLRLGLVSGGLGDAFRLLFESLCDAFRLVSETLGAGYRGLSSSPAFYFLVIVATATFLVYSWMNRQWRSSQDGNTPNNGTQ